jgi:hypothetical protein
MQSLGEINGLCEQESPSQLHREAQVGNYLIQSQSDRLLREERMLGRLAKHPEWNQYLSGYSTRVVRKNIAECLHVSKYDDRIVQVRNLQSSEDVQRIQSELLRLIEREGTPSAEVDPLRAQVTRRRLITLLTGVKIAQYDLRTFRFRRFT